MERLFVPLAAQGFHVLGKGGNIPRSPWNQQTRGLKTRSTKKAFGWMIVSDRRKNKVK